MGIWSLTIPSELVSSGAASPNMESKLPFAIQFPMCIRNEQKNTIPQYTVAALTDRPVLSEVTQAKGASLPSKAVIPKLVHWIQAVTRGL